MSHMVADSIEELHQMADEIGLPRKWFQRHHYDICYSKKKLAVENGAIALNLGRRDELVRFMAVWKRLRVAASK